jgi:hypothetical protein
MNAADGYPTIDNFAPTDVVRARNINGSKQDAQVLAFGIVLISFNGLSIGSLSINMVTAFQVFDDPL